MIYSQLQTENDNSENFYYENDMINTIAGLTMQLKSFPNSLNKLGYNIVSIEKSFRNSNKEEVKFDIIINSEIFRNLIAWECKSGFNTEAEQLKKYNELYKEELINGIDILCGDIENYEMNITVMCNAQKCERIKIGIDGKYKFPLIAIDKENNHLTLKYNKFQTENLNATFNNIKIPEEIPQIIRFTKESEKHEVASTLFQNILSYALRSINVVKIEELCESIITTYDGIYKIIGKDLIKSIRNKIKSILREAPCTELNGYLVWDRRGQTVTIKKINSTNPATLNAYRIRTEIFINRIKQNLPFSEEVIKGQLTMQNIDEIEE